MSPSDDLPDSPKTSRWSRGPHLVALIATASTWPLLFVGGLVTTYRVGMAVPDWPTTFGINMFVYDMSQAAWGVLVEHGHRLYGAAVGLGCVFLALWYTLAAGRRSWVPMLWGLAAAVVFGLVARATGKVDPLIMGIVTVGPASLGLAAWFGLVRKQGLVAFAWLLLAAVIGQGALGGLRVRMNSTDLAALHGCTGQLFFAAIVALCVVSGKVWQSTRPAEPDRVGLRWMAPAFAVLVYLQIVAGAWLRHYSLGLTIHSSLAGAVFIGAHVVAIPAIRLKRALPEIVPSARTLLILTAAQFLLGLLSWWLLRPFDGIPKLVTGPQALVRTAHQANGALVLAAAVVLAMRVRRLLTPAPAAVEQPITAPLGAVPQ
jgi:cytochrome c oxidase assembly protein subunit 15